MKARGSDLKVATRRRPRLLPPAADPKRAPQAPAADEYPRWPMALSAAVFLGVSIALWAAVIGGGLALVRLFG